VTLGILYHMPFWQTADGALWEAEGSFARYVDSLAPYFDEILVAAPAFDTPPASGSLVRARNVRFAPLPYFPGPRQFYPQLLTMYRRLSAWVQQSDVIHLRVPTPPGIFAYSIARRLHKPIFLLVVGDYRALLPHLPYRGLKRAAFAAYVAWEERALSRMTRGALTFVNGAALRVKHERGGVDVYETRTTTLSDADIDSKADTCRSSPVRLLTVSRIDPRKGLRVLPEAVERLVAAGANITLDIIGAPIGRIGEDEQTAILDDVARRGLVSRISIKGAVPLDVLMRRYREYDVFVLPTRPGEGIPRVLMEAMAAGLPVITSNVSGIGSLVRDGDNGLLLSSSSAEEAASAVRRVLDDAALRQRLIAGGYRTARAHTLERQAAEMMAVVERKLGVALAAVPSVA